MNALITPTDELFELELRIARRADQLARLSESDPQSAMEYWHQAEQEVWFDSLAGQVDRCSRQAEAQPVLRT